MVKRAVSPQILHLQSVKRIGVLGTFVWDEIWHPAVAGQAVEQWGGLAYSLAGFSAACPHDWSIFPIARVGSDLVESARAFLGALPNLGSTDGLRVVPEPNNRVQLRYLDGAEREETLTGGVGGWEAGELLPIIDGLDALYVNFLAGDEMRLDLASRLRDHVVGPVYADLHSLFLGPPGRGPRPPRRLDDWERWVACFDTLQMNEVELSLLGPPRPDPFSLLQTLPTLGPSLALITRGPLGATYARRHGEVEVEDVPLIGSPVEGDPTGCGDVWGSVAFCGFLGGLPLQEALRRANLAAASKIRAGSIGEIARVVREALRPGE